MGWSAGVADGDVHTAAAGAVGRFSGEEKLGGGAPGGRVRVLRGRAQPHRPQGTQSPPTDEKVVANRDLRDFGWEIAHGAVTRRPPISLYTMLPGATRTTLGFGICPSFKYHSLSPRAKPWGYDSQLLHRCTRHATLPPCPLNFSPSPSRAQPPGATRDRTHHIRVFAGEASPSPGPE